VRGQGQQRIVALTPDFGEPGLGVVIVAICSRLSAQVRFVAETVKNILPIRVGEYVVIWVHVEERRRAKPPALEPFLVCRGERFGPLVIALVIGMSQADVGGRATATLEYRDVRHVAPVFHGDTIYSRSTILEKADGMVTVASEGVNQRGEVVVKLERKIAVPTA